MQMVPLPAANRPGRVVLAWAALGVYGLAILEIAIMSTPFAAYYYTVTAPLLDFVVESPHLVWLSEFFISHLSEPEALLLILIKKLALGVALLGLASFVVHAIYLYWVKFARRAVAARLLYAWVRHPQYGCWIVAGAGLAVMWPRFGNLLLWIFMISAYYALARHEERQMERRHGASYRDYMASKAMFLPGDRVVGRWLQSSGRSGRALAGTVAMALLIAGSLSCRAWSVAQLDALQPPGFPGTLVVAMNPPRDAEISALASAAAQEAQVAAGPQGTPNLLYLIWGKKRLRHFLIDGGIDRAVFEQMELPDARVFLVTASVGHPGRAMAAPDLNAPDWALTLHVRRRLRSVLYAPAGTETGTGPLDWLELRLPTDAAYAHSSLPIL